MTAATQDVLPPFSTEPRDILGLGAIDIDSVARRLDAVREDQRVAFVRALTKPAMIRLWDACEGRNATAADFVPAHVPVGTQVIHEGRNSLPAFSRFQKRFSKSERDGVVYGYNHSDTSWAL